MLNKIPKAYFPRRMVIWGMPNFQTHPNEGVLHRNSIFGYSCFIFVDLASNRPVIVIASDIITIRFQFRTS